MEVNYLGFFTKVIFLTSKVQLFLSHPSKTVTSFIPIPNTSHQTENTSDLEYTGLESAKSKTITKNETQYSSTAKT